MSKVSTRQTFIRFRHHSIPGLLRGHRSTTIRAGLGLIMLRGASVSLGILVSALSANPTHAQSNPSGSGTAFFVNADGWAVTNAHVLEGCTRASVPTMGEATDWIVDRQNDLAAVKVAGGIGKPFLQLRDPAPRLGDDIAAFGYPLHGLLSDSIKVTTGNINSLVGIDNDTRYLQISTPLQPGNSGGPVVDRSGSVLGVATAVLGSRFADNTGILPQNVNFAVRSNVLELFLQSRSIEYESLPASGDELSTADLAELVAPAVVQILCFSDSSLPPVATDRGPRPQGDPAPAPSSAPSARELATVFAHAYHEAWSSPNEVALAFMSGVYTEDVEFYGNVVSAASVMEEKRKFAHRWPIRDYSVRDGSLSAACTGSVCSVSAIIDWFAHSPSRAKSSNGVAAFEFRLNTDRLSITRETGSVSRGQTASPNGMLVRWHDQNGKCRGGSGESQETWQACDAREHTQKSLVAAGWCYGRQGEYGYQMEWHRCEARSLRD